MSGDCQHRPLNICFHEAGHAFARWYFGYDTDRVAIVTEARDAPTRLRLAMAGARGFVQGPAIIAWTATCKEGDGSDKPGHWSDIMMAVEIDLVVTFSGVMAEARHCGSNPFTLAGFTGDRTLVNATLRQWYAPRLRQQAFDEAGDRALALMNPRSWPGIAALALAVQRHGRVYKHYIDDILSRALAIDQPRQADWKAHWPPPFAMLSVASVPSNMPKS